MVRKAKIISILKHGKLKKIQRAMTNIVTIHCLQIIERILLVRIQKQIKEVLPVKQAGFGQGRNCIEQVLSLT